MSELAQYKRPLSKKTKVVIGLTVTVLILAIVGVVVFMLLNNGPRPNPYGIIITNNTNTASGLWSNAQTWVYRSIPISVCQNIEKLTYILDRQCQLEFSKQFCPCDTWISVQLSYTWRTHVKQYVVCTKWRHYL